MATASCEPTAFYAMMNASSSGAALKASLHSLISPHTVVSYANCWEALRVLDASPANASEVSLIYSSFTHAAAQQGQTTGWNREHCTFARQPKNSPNPCDIDWSWFELCMAAWPKSYGIGYSGPDFSDLHALFACDWSVNSARSNRFYDACESGCTSPAHAEAAATTAKDTQRFQPEASRRGDLARSMFYMAVRYDGAEPYTTDLELADIPDASSSTFGNLSTLLRWHAADPVSDAERTRNELVCGYQRNRNPFVDHPEWAACVFANACETEPGRRATSASARIVMAVSVGGVAALALLLIVGWLAGGSCRRRWPPLAKLTEYAPNKADAHQRAKPPGAQPSDMHVTSL